MKQQQQQQQKQRDEDLCAACAHVAFRLGSQSRHLDEREPFICAPVGNDNDSPALHDAVQSLLDDVLRVCVEGGGRFVQEEHAGPAHRDHNSRHTALSMSVQLPLDEKPSGC